MRLISLLILAAIVGGGAFVFFFKPEWIGMAKKKIDETLYPPAKSPREAMEKFLKAVKERDYSVAAVYATKDYGDKLIKVHTGARALGSAIDKVNSYLEEKQFKSDKTTQLLFLLDPFPAEYLKIGDVKEVKGKQVGIFVFAPPVITQGYRLDELKSLDPEFFGLNALGAPVPGVHEIKSEGEGDAKVWKIEFQVPQGVHDGMEYFNSHYKSYVSHLDTFRGELRQDRFLKDKIAPELLQVLISAK